MFRWHPIQLIPLIFVNHVTKELIEFRVLDAGHTSGVESQSNPSLNEHNLIIAGVATGENFSRFGRQTVEERFRIADIDEILQLLDWK